jgi:hypothetical protein
VLEQVLEEDLHRVRQAGISLEAGFASAGRLNI